MIGYFVYTLGFAILCRCLQITHMELCFEMLG